MSDGPYKSLPMRPAWKKVAELAENENFDVDQVAERLHLAVAEDFRKEVPHEIINLLDSVFKEGEGDLFPEQRQHDLSNARRLVDGSPLGSFFLDCAVQELAEGKVGQQGLKNAAEAAIHDRMQSGARQIEEHYLRHHDSSRHIIGKRIQEAISRVATDDVVRQTLRIGSETKLGAVRHQGIDDGVPLT